MLFYVLVDILFIYNIVRNDYLADSVSKKKEKKENKQTNVKVRDS